jgi:hypothetical protein
MKVRPCIARVAIVLPLVIMLLPFAVPPVLAEAPTANAAVDVTVRLINITIPPDSRLRNLSKINRPPLLYLQLYEDGSLIGTSSTVTDGWEVDFPDVKANRWTVKRNPKTRYSIKIMDDQWFGDEIVFEVTGCKGKDLRGLVRERGPVSEATDRLATVEFEVVSDVPAKSSVDDESASK